MCQTVPHQKWSLDFSRFSNWKILLRVIGWVKRFIQNSRSVKKQWDVRQPGPAEMVEAEVYSIKPSQKKYFKQEYETLQTGGHVSTSSKPASISPELDSDGLIRCNGRLKYSEILPYNARFPVILPRDSCVTRLIVRWYHEENNHSAGTNHLLLMLSSRNTQIIASYVRKTKQLLLHSSWLLFHKWDLSLTTGYSVLLVLILLGHFWQYVNEETKDTCISLHVYHLGQFIWRWRLGWIYTTAFLNGFYRIVNRRRVPMEVITNNSRCFVAAYKELKELVSHLDKEKIKEVTSLQRSNITWHFNPPFAPPPPPPSPSLHFGGILEIIKSAKQAMYDHFKNADINDEKP